jgi:hypothetical protein
MDLDSGDFTSAEQDEMDAWALDCLRMFLPMVPVYAIESVLTRLSSQASPVSLPSDSMKIVRVSGSTSGDLLKEKAPDEFSQIKAFYSGSAYSAGNRIWTSLMGKVYGFELGGEAVDLDYIAEPVWVSTNLSIPNGWEGIVIDYTVVKAKMKDEEPEQGKLLWDIFLQGLKRFQGFENIAKLVGG